jgi:hypothetical protein
MPSTERRPRRIDLKLPPSGGGATADAATTEPVPPAIPAPPAPSGLTVEDTFLIQSAVTPQAGANLAWYAPSGLVPDRYALQWATNSGFTTPTTRDVPGGGQTTAGVDGLPVGTAVYFRVAAVVRGVQGAWSNTASATMPADTTAPAAPTHASTAYTWSGLTGDLTINWVNPTSANFRDVRVRIYASNGGTLYREVYSATGAYTWTLGQHFTDTSNTPDPAVYVVLTSRSWGGVFSATDLTFSPAIGAPTTPAGFASSWAADDGTASADLLFTWTRSNAVADYQLTLNGTARRVGHNDRYLLTFAQNQAENGGTADPSILNAALVAVDALGQVSGTPAFLTPTNAAPPATTVTAFAGSSAVGLTITPSAARDLKDYRVRVYLATVLVDTVYVPNARPTITIQHGDGSYTFDVSARDLFDQVGTASAQTAAVDLVDWDAFLDELRSGAVYSDQLATAAETLHDAYTDDNRASGGVAYATNASWVRWIRFERLERERYRTVTLAMAPAGGTTNWYIRTSEDATTWAYYAGPVTSSRILTAVANAAAAQAAPVSAATLGNASASRVDFPAILSARYVEVWLRNTTSSTTVNEFYPRRLVQSDDLEAEAIKAIHITTDAILSNHITATAIDGFTITGATIQTAASGERVVLDSTGLKTYDSLGNVVISAGTDSDGALENGNGTIRIDSGTLLIKTLYEGEVGTPVDGGLIFVGEDGIQDAQVYSGNGVFLGDDTLYFNMVGGGDIAIEGGGLVIEGDLTVIGQIRPGGVGALAYNSANLALTTATSTVITLNSERFDTDSFHSTASNTSRLTVPTGMGGIYQITAQARFASNSTGIRLILVRLNGTTTIAQQSMTAISGNETDMVLSTVYNLAAGDYVELLAYQNSGGNLDLQATSASPVLAMVKQ